MLYVRGEITPSDARAVAIVGTRRATRYGLRTAETLARGLVAAGVTVVSGLARGIDGAAHEATLAAGGRTIASLAGGLAKTYPPEHADLASRVAEQGALVAEAAPHTPPMAGSFPQRNRIISGLSLGVVVIEAAERSGALITARHAAEQGRDAFALPGPWDSAASRGCHRLIQEGAKLVTCVDDILEELPETLAPVPSRRPATTSATPAATADRPNEPPHHLAGLSEPCQQVWRAIGEEATTVDQLIDRTELPIEQVLVALSTLEATRRVRRISGTLVARA